MNNENLQDLYQSKVMDHYRSPRNYEVMEDFTHKAEGFNRLCGDRVIIFLKVSEDSLLEKISFHGESCAICKASASMLTEFVSRLSVDEVKERLAFLHKFSEIWQEDKHLGSFQAFVIMKDFSTRLKCLRLPWKTLEAAVSANSVSYTTTEEPLT